MACQKCGKDVPTSLCVDCFAEEVKASQPPKPPHIKENRYSGEHIEYGVLSALFEMYPESNVGLVAPQAQLAFNEGLKFLHLLCHNQCELAGCHSNGEKTVHSQLCILHPSRYGQGGNP